MNSISTSPERATGTWTYTPGGAIQLLIFLSRGWTQFNLFSNLGDPNPDDLSHAESGGNPLDYRTYVLRHRSEVPADYAMLLGAGLLAARFPRRAPLDLR